MPKILAGQPITYFIIEDTTQKERLNQPASEEKIKFSIRNRTDIARSFQMWFFHTQQTIKQAGRTHEFTDIMPLLARGVKLQEVASVQEADVIFHFTSESEIKKQCGDSTVGCHFHQHIFVPFADNNDTQEYAFETLTHEIGHFLGLADQYAGPHNSSVVHSTQNLVSPKKSIMNTGHGIGCDDVDGFINVIDWTLAHKNNGTYSARAKKGWKSFCGGNTHYRKAKVLNKADFAVEECFYRFTSSGDVKQKVCPEPFIKRNRKIDYWDDGIPYTLTDKKLNLFIQYVTLFEDHPEVVAFVHDLTTDKEIMRLRAQRQIRYGDPNWEFMISQEIRFSDGQCIFSDGKDIGGFEFIYIILERGGKLNHATYEFSRNIPTSKYEGDNPTLLTTKPIQFKLSAEENKGKPYTCSIDLE